MGISLGVTEQVVADRIVEQMRGMTMTIQPGGNRLTVDEERRREITKRLHDLGPSAVPALVRALRDADVQMRRNAALVLIDLGGGYTPEARPALDIREALRDLIASTEDEDGA